MRAALAALVPALIASAPVAAQVAVELQGQAVQGGFVRGRAPPGTTLLSLGGAPVPLADDRSFILGFDRDHPALASLSARLADGRTVERTIAVAPRSWRIEHVDVAQRPPSVPDEAYRRRREAELARIREARSRRSQAEGWR